MLTARGWWLFVIALFQTALGILLIRQAGLALAILGLGILAFVLVEWVRFRFRVAHVLPQLRFQRVFLSEGRVVASAFPRLRIEVRLHIENPTRWNLHLIQIRDLIPAGSHSSEEASGCWVNLQAKDSCELVYTIVPESAGILRFHGIGLRLVDPQGFFAHRVVLRKLIELPVFPSGLRRFTQPKITKRQNALPSPGVQRYLRPGGAGDLLDLRDYMPGDPPKLIAWKQTARRDKLIVKELESEVPLRCTLYVDTSGSALDSSGANGPREVLVQSAATIAESLLRNRDYVGLQTFDESSSLGLAPARSSRQRLEILHRLAQATAQPTASDDIDWLTRQSHATAAEIHPDLIDKRINTTPLGLFWEPLLDSPRAWVVLVLLLAPLLFIWGDFRFTLETFAEMQGIRDYVGFMGAVAGGSILLGLLVWLVHGFGGLWPSARNRILRRKQLATLFVALDGDEARLISRYREFDEPFGNRCRRYLKDHALESLGNGTPPPIRLPANRRTGIAILTRSLLRGMSLARDNELFVLFGNFSDCEPEWPTLFRALRMIRGRHHEVVCICQRYPMTIAPSATITEVERDLLTELARHYNRQLERFQTQVRKLGVQLLWADREDTVARIVRRMADLRTARIRR